MSKPVILTGLRANTDFHIGNYLGAILPIVDIAKKHAGEYQVNLFIPDLHSFTTPIDHSKLKKQINDNLKVFGAAGLPIEHSDVHIYRQSFIPAHSELAWILNCFSRFGELNRMTQYKEKVHLTENEKKRLIDEQLDRVLEEYKDHPQVSKLFTIAELRKLVVEVIEENEETINKIKSERSSVGLFDYPVLMAADILLYGTQYVPVGDDQTQHLEFTRDIAERMNKKFGELFIVPKPVKEQHKFFGKDQGLRIRDLADPTKKMSKSDETGKGVIFLSDSSEVAKKKVMSATTDSLENIQYDYEKQPGLSNLLDIYKLLGGNPKEFIGQKQYGPFKAAAADKVSEFLSDFHTKLTKVDESKLNAKLVSSEAKMNQQASATLVKVQKAVGLR